MGPRLPLAELCLASLFKSIWAFPSCCVYLVLSFPAQMFLHSQDLSQGPYHDLHWERCHFLSVQWSFLESFWILLSWAPSPQKVQILLLLAQDQHEITKQSLNSQGQTASSLPSFSHFSLEQYQGWSLWEMS